MLPLYLAACGLACGLERLHGRPFVASLMGHLVARTLGGRRLAGAAEGETLYEVAWLPAVGFRAAAQTWGEVVLVTPEAYRVTSGERRVSPDLLAHERCHVAQFRRLTSFGFWVRYAAAWAWGLLRYRDPFRAYWDLALEREARAAAARPDDA
ncbi:hypothetical protein [Truepera radiovictrix]|uniref:DUF4157 domain-containing protein n=1 Tax=Truepera radiovictrix (strain DSM 17093 / CIP 108686 / LMG 22925 / RQ-24) TaxID=649638 RepID=D7CU29_TRURR|nr:hypothetical protein [Truepera radiovictrix]ADI13927.1 hypothetical protein Trad_0793 [Truepera radiovictrix DSM 17093]WMT57508.1 hypothetical protein RCV51_00865 [Truepera radiovictrix]